MADNTVRYVVYIDGTGAARSGLMSMESAAVATERSIASLNNTLRGMAGAMGIGLGLHSFVDFGKEAVEGAADYETAIKRIKFASDDLVEGAKNIAFIRSEVDKFGIPLQSATDAYGKFLAMLAGSEIPSEKVRKLHDELLLIGKIKGLDEGQLNAAVMNLGKMLESGSLDARHFRPLEQQLSGIGAFVAKELGISVHQLAILRNQGKMTQIDPKVLLTAIEKQAASLEGFLPESLTTIRTGLNQLTTDWVEFKNNLVYDNRAELEALFATLKSGIKYLNDHRDGIVSTGKAVLAIGEIWLKYKGAMLLVNAAQSIYNGFMAGYASTAATVITATEAKAVAMNHLALSMERVAYATELMAGASLTGAVGLGAAGIPLASAGTMGLAGAGMAGAGVAGAASGAAAGKSAGLMRAAIPVAIMWMTAEVASQLLPKTPGGHQLNWKDFFGFSEFGHSVEAMAKGIVAYRPGMETHSELIRLTSKMYGGVGKVKYDDKGYPVFPSATGNENLDTQILLWQESKGYLKSIDGKLIGGRLLPPTGLQETYGIKPGFGKPGFGKTEKHDKIMPPNDTVTGQRLITYNISIKEINGIKQNTVQEGGKMDTDRTAEVLRDVIQSILNDSQIRAGY